MLRIIEVENGSPNFGLSTIAAKLREKYYRKVILFSFVNYNNSYVGD